MSDINLNRFFLLRARIKSDKGFYFLYEGIG